MINEKELAKLSGKKGSGNRLTFDGKVPGFAVCVTASGATSFILNYRIHGRQRRYTIGRYPEISVADARDEALDLRQQIRKGLDPLDRRTNSREAPTVTALARKYFEYYADKAKRPSTLRNDHQMLENKKNGILAELGSLQVSAVTRQDIEDFHASLRATPYRANRMLSLLSHLFVKAIEWGHRTDNPVAHVKRFPEERRERWLKQDELNRLTAALEKYPHRDVANAITLLLLTGARKSEVLSATWSQFDLERGMWTKPSSHTKQKKTEHTPLGKAALALLTEMNNGLKGRPLYGADYLFPGRYPGEHLLDVKNGWKELCKAAKLDGVRIHDLRHTFASHLVSSGVPLAIVGRLLGHSQSRTTERYSHLADSPLREATDRFGKLVSRRPA